MSTNNTFNLKKARHQFLLIKAAKDVFQKKDIGQKAYIIKCFLSQPYPSSYNAHNQVILLKNNSNNNPVKRIPEPKNFNPQDIIKEVTALCYTENPAITLETYRKNPENIDKFNSVYFGFAEGFFSDIKISQKSNHSSNPIARDKAYRLAIQISNKILMEENLEPYLKNLKIVTSGMDTLYQYALRKIYIAVGFDKFDSFKNNVVKTPQQIVNSSKKKSFFSRAVNKVRSFFSKKKK
jgi:hypothetical protein